MFIAPRIWSQPKRSRRCPHSNEPPGLVTLRPAAKHRTGNYGNGSRIENIVRNIEGDGEIVDCGPGPPASGQARQDVVDRIESNRLELEQEEPHNRQERDSRMTP